MYAGFFSYNACRGQRSTVVKFSFRWSALYISRVLHYAWSSLLQLASNPLPVSACHHTGFIGKAHHTWLSMDAELRLSHSWIMHFIHRVTSPPYLCLINKPLAYTQIQNACIHLSLNGSEYTLLQQVSQKQKASTRTGLSVRKG